MAQTARKNQLAPGISRLSRSKVFSKRAAYKIAKTAQPKAEEAPAKAKKVTRAKKGDLVAALTAKHSALHPANVVPQPKAGRKTQRTQGLRKSITPGTVLILLAGRFRGKRVVFLKQLSSGLLLVTGPFKINGVPLRRVNQAYVIATSTKVDLSGVSVDAKFDDAYFKREEEAKLKGTEEEFFGKSATKKEAPAHKVADQKEADKAVVAAVAKVPFLASYLASTFSLTKGQAPHSLKF
ncbi:60S ribosomal protein L6 [Linderina pennispora]|uniref:60S ribosomal protein L6 n=1 Tax=Linderina pennispora TaxID=61395 RepID=A0A1Y1W2I5_9FUNG|nr:60S ribosomal protein L6 [Linderina pennispora]KAJ1948785.1 60S ribosomal protein L6 [Linderina pennispora]ORX67763.1 60S ribosomal protein L6 [Linderina pennispora]